MQPKYFATKIFVNVVNLWIHKNYCSQNVLWHTVVYFVTRLLPVLSRSCWSTSTISLSISIYLVVEQSTLLKQFPCSNRVDVLPIVINHINSILAVSTSLNSLHNSPMYVVSDSTLLHVPFPMADSALIRTSYTVPASRAARIVDVVEPGETGLAAFQLVSLLLYSTWY